MGRLLDMRIAGKASSIMRAHARSLRENQTDAERLLWACLRRGQLEKLRFRRQQPVGPFILDFYCHRARLAIELDGGQHLLPEHAARDRERDRYLMRHGIRVLRFYNDQVLNRLPDVLAEIHRQLLAVKPSP